MKLSKKAVVKQIGVVLLIVVGALAVFMVSKWNQDSTLRFDSTYDKYGFYPEEKTFINYDGLRYQLRDDGGVNVKDQAGRTQVVYGFGMSGNYNGKPIIRTELDYEWTWEHTTEEVYFSQIEYNETGDANNISYVMTKHIFTGKNNDKDFPLIQKYEFTPKDPAKITTILENNWHDLTDTKFWYILRDGETIRYNGQMYAKTETIDVKVGKTRSDLNAITPRVEFFDGGFDYEDMLKEDFKLIEVSSKRDFGRRLEEKSIGLGFTKGAGNFNVGQTIILDPTSTGFTDPVGHSDPQNQWTNPAYILALDTSRATETTNGDNFTLDWDGFSLDPDAVVLGIEIQSTGYGSHFTCPVKAYGTYNAYLSINNGTLEGTESDEFKGFFHGCQTTPPFFDDVQTQGSSTFLWGLDDYGTLYGANMTADSFRMRGSETGAVTMNLNHVQANIYWELPQPVLTSISPTPANDSIIGSTYYVNVSSDITLATCTLETNANGTNVNYTMELYNSSKNAQITRSGLNYGVDDGTNFNFTVWCESGGDYGTLAITNVTSDSVVPQMIINTPPSNFNTYPDEDVVFNLTNNDTEEDIIDAFLVTNFGSGYNVRNYVHFGYDIDHAEDFIKNRTIGEIDATSNDTFRYFKLDGYSEFGEADGVTVRDFSNNYSTYSQGSFGVPVFSSTDGRCGNAPCLFLDGTNDNILLESGSSGETTSVINDMNFSVGAWLYDTSIGNNVWFGKGSNTAGAKFLELSKDNAINYFKMYNSDGVAICNSTYSGGSTNVLYHIAYVGDGTNLLTYYNGQHVQTDDCSGFVANDTYWNTGIGAVYEYYLGAFGVGGQDNEWFGWIDEFFIVNRTLSAREIANIHRPIRTQYNWILRAYQSPNNYSDTSGNFVHLLDILTVDYETTLQGLYTDVQEELPEDPSIINFSDVDRPCRYVVSRTINVTSGGNLVMDGCTLEMNNSEEDGEYDLIISGTGMLTANYSNFTKASTARYEFKLLENSSLVLNNSYVSYTGRGVTNLIRGLAINTTNVVFENNTLSNGYRADLEILSSNISFVNSRFLGNNGLGTITENNIYCVLCDNVKIVDSSLTGASLAEVIVLENQTVYLLNTTHSSHDMDDGGNLYKQWYVDGIVQNDTDPLNDSEVTFYNTTGDTIIVTSTNESGHIPRQNLTEYIVNGSNVKIYQTNYSIKATKSGYDDNTISFNFTTNSDFTINLTIASADTCTYTSGTWNVLCSDNCNIDSNVDLGGNNFVLEGTGTFDLDGANMTNIGNFTFGGSCTFTRKNGAWFPFW